MSFESIIGCCKEVSFPIAEQRNEHFCCPDFLVTGNFFEFLGAVCERDELFEEVDFRNDAEKVFYGNAQLSFDPDGDFLGFFNDFIVHADSVFFFVEDVAGFAEVLIVVGHQFHLVVDLLNQFFFLVGEFAVGVAQEQPILELLSQLEGLV